MERCDQPDRFVSQQCPHHFSLRGANHLYSGASYATTGPNILDPKPPFQGQTTCNGPNYIDFLSNGFNKSIIKTKEYAIPGSPVTWSVLDPKDPSSHGNSFEIQVNTYLGDFKNNLFPGWSAANTLYHTEFGINDINTAGSDYASLEAQIFEKYSSLFDTVCHSQSLTKTPQIPFDLTYSLFSFTSQALAISSSSMCHP